MNLDKFQVTIPITDRQKELVDLWLTRFHDGAIHVWSDIKHTPAGLVVHPADFPNVLSFAKIVDCSEFEFYQIKRAGAQSIADGLNSKNRLSTELLEMVTSALKGITLQATGGLKLG